LCSVRTVTVNIREGEVTLIQDMKISLFQLVTVLGLVLVAALSGCAAHDETLQSRIEKDVNNPDTGNIQLGSKSYNQFSQEYDPAWPFGPLSTH
jgi:hypothetical protein